MTGRSGTFAGWACLGALLLVGCGGPTRPQLIGATSSAPDGSVAGSCLSPSQGCPCSSDGETVSCGRVTTRDGDYVTCSEGSTTCTAGSWGACLGDTRTERRIVPHGGEYAVLVNIPLPTSDGGVCADNPCDPDCNTFVVGIDDIEAGADSGFDNTDSGLSLTGNLVPVTDCTALQVTPDTAPTKDLLVT